MTIHEIIHAWERTSLPTDSKGIKAVRKTVEKHRDEMAACEKEAMSMQIKSYYNFDLGVCAHILADVERIEKTLEEQEGGEQK